MQCPSVLQSIDITSKWENVGYALRDKRERKRRQRIVREREREKLRKRSRDRPRRETENAQAADRKPNKSQETIKRK